MSDHDRFRDDCGAYVLGALEELEAEALRQHLEVCLLCRDDVDRLTAAAEVLGLGVPTVPPPPELRIRVLDAVRQEAALCEQAAGPRPAARRRRLRWSPLGGLAGAALALGVALGALVIAPGGPSTRVVSAAVAPAARWHGTRGPVALLRESGTQGELMFSDLPAAPDGKLYEVWIRRGGRTQPTRVLFDATSAGTATVAVPDLGGATAVLVAGQRLGGARTPTMKPLVVAQLS